MKWFFAGLGIGVTMGVVLAPAKGEEARRMLRDSASNAWDEMSGTARSTAEQVRNSDLGRSAAQTMDRVRQQAGKVAESVRDRTAGSVQSRSETGSTATGTLGQRTGESDRTRRSEHRREEMQGSSATRESMQSSRATTPRPMPPSTAAPARPVGDVATRPRSEDIEASQTQARDRNSVLDLLNEASQDELIAVNGIGPALALKIVQNRPFRSEQQPLEENVLPPSAIESLRSHLKRTA